MLVYIKLSEFQYMWLNINEILSIRCYENQGCFECYIYLKNADKLIINDKHIALSLVNQINKKGA